jgi:hypothetical protein
MYEILPYKSDMESRWDRFVMEESVNGTFLQTRRFLNYHPKGRFQDASFLIEKSGIVVAAVPGCNVDGKFVSHQGSTFGGPIISKDFFSASRLLEIVNAMDQFLTGQYEGIKLKPTARIFCTEPTDLLEYALEHKGYTRHTELSAYTALCATDPLEQCKRECRHNFRLSEALNLNYGEIPESSLEEFYKFLELSKARYNTKPVHTLSELRDLKKRFPEEILFRGIWQDGTYLSGMMIFVFQQAKAFHFQYLAPDDSKRETNATTALFVNALREAAKAGFQKFSWGISTEDGGNYLNESLYRFKESFGSKPCVNVTYVK